MKKYEAVFILDEHFVEDQGKQFSEEFAALVKDIGGEIEISNPMGRKQFTYEIKKKKAGCYWNFLFLAPKTAVSAIKDKYKLDERVLRMRIFDDVLKGKKATVEDV